MRISLTNKSYNVLFHERIYHLKTVILMCSRNNVNK